MEVQVFDDRVCQLGEGALWHPERQQFFWFDILQNRLLSRVGEKALSWQFEEHVSAAGWVDRNSLLIASECSLALFNIETGSHDFICHVEQNNPITRSNDGRADPWGGFWIGSMGKAEEHKGGAIYRYYRGELRCLYPDFTITNSISFSPNGLFAYFSDTGRGKIWRQKLNSAHGWPKGEPELFVDCKAAGVNPDGAVVDQQGNLWCAKWGSSQVLAYAPDSEVIATVTLPAAQITCPAFGGERLNQLFATSAANGLSTQQLAQQPLAGQTFVVTGDAFQGQAEHAVIL